MSYASERSLGRKLPFAGGDVACEVLRPGCFDGLDLVIVDVDDPLALEWAPPAAAAGARVVDNSAAFRMDPDVPLVIAEVNPGDLASLPKGIASCPNCTTMIPVTALAPLHRAARIDRMVVSTYQSVSGAGQVGLHELDAQWTKLSGRSEELRRAGTLSAPVVEGEVWSKPIAGNVIPLAGSVKEEGYTSEEWKMIRETRKILHDDAIRCTVTCVRVPVYVGHAVSANVRFHRPMSKAEAVELLRDAPGRTPRRRRRRLPDAARRRRYRPRARRAGSARTARSRDRSTSGSPVTTCARARPSTRSRWPRCCSPCDRCHSRGVGAIPIVQGLNISNASSSSLLQALAASQAATGSSPVPAGSSPELQAQSLLASSDAALFGEFAGSGSDLPDLSGLTGAAQAYSLYTDPALVQLLASGPATRAPRLRARAAPASRQS